MDSDPRGFSKCEFASMSLCNTSLLDAIDRAYKIESAMTRPQPWCCFGTNVLHRVPICTKYINVRKYKSVPDCPGDFVVWASTGPSSVGWAVRGYGAAVPYHPSPPWSAPSWPSLPPSTSRSEDTICDCSRSRSARRRRIVSWRSFSCRGKFNIRRQVQLNNSFMRVGLWVEI